MKWFKMFLIMFLGSILSIYLIGSFMAWDFNLIRWPLFVENGVFNSLGLRGIILILFIISVVYGGIFADINDNKKK